MSDKPAALASFRQSPSPSGVWRASVSGTPGLPARRLTRQQRAEQERLDRYGRFGRR